MNTHTKVIIYDDTCPLCDAYTGCFVQIGLIAKENRKNFNTITPELMAKIDGSRCINEIPVIDTQTNEIWYGIDAMLEILGGRIPLIKRAGNWKPVKWILCIIYKFISYNRRVIVAPRHKPGNFDCKPDFNIPYRIAFMAFFLVCNTAMLYPLAEYVLSDSIFSNAGLANVQLAHIVLVAINITIALQLNRTACIEYLGQINMLALLVNFINLPLIIANIYFPFFDNLINNIYLFMLAFFTCGEYIRRIKFAGIMPGYPWIVAANIASVVVFMIYLMR